MSNTIKYSIFGIISFLIGYFYYSRKPKQVNEDFNLTLAKKKDGKHFLVFNSVVVLSREVTLDQYNNFLATYPTGKAPSNVLDQFSSPTVNRYTCQDGKYYEYKWDGSKYINAIEITKEEFKFLTNKTICSDHITI